MERKRPGFSGLFFRTTVIISLDVLSPMKLFMLLTG